MIYGSVCSGIEAATVAWHQLGWKPAWFSEIEPFPCRLLAHYYPATPNLGDMLTLHEKEIFQQSIIDVLVGGTPCQSFSTAGLRAGLDSPNGNLALQFCRILAAKRPRWFVWENVPGVFSSGKGEDFRSIIRGFSECGYSISWRVLDAQFFGVPQRRRRVFVVGYLGDDWRPLAAVLFEPEGMRGYSPKGRKEGEEVAGTIGRRTGGRSIGAEEAGGNQLVIAKTLRAVGHDASDDGTKQNFIVETGRHCTMATGQPNAEILENLAPTLNCNHEQPIVFSVYFEQRVGRNGRGMPDNVAAPLKAQSGQTGKGDSAPCIVYDGAQITSAANGSNPQPGDPASTLAKGSRMLSIMPMNSSKDYKAREVEVSQPITTQQGISNNGGDIVQQFSQAFQSSQSGVRLVDTHATLDANNGLRRHNGIINGSIVRRLTPLECERLQGFPDNYTAIPGAADSPRYEAIGNSMAVPVMEWLGKRIHLVDLGLLNVKYKQ